jgi:hypothetical protein
MQRLTPQSKTPPGPIVVTDATTSSGSLDQSDQPDQKTPFGPSLPWVLLVFALTRIYLALFFEPQLTDLQVYFNYAVQGVDLKRTAYKDFAIEYPPVAYWLIALPRYVSGEPISEEIYRDPPQRERYFAVYARGYSSLMLLLDFAALALLLGIVRRRAPDRLALVAGGYLLTTTLLGHVLYDRLDVGVLLLLLGWCYTRIRATESGAGYFWNPLSYLLLGLSVSFKLLGIVAIPFVLLADWWSPRRADRRAVECLVLVISAVAGMTLPFALHYPAAGWSTLDFLKYHGERGIEIESTYASVMLLLAPFGQEISVEISHGSANLMGSMAGVTSTAAMILFPAGLMICGLWAWRRRPGFDRITGYRTAVFAILMTLVFSKVLSAQFFVFALPLMTLLSIELLPRRGTVAIIALGSLLALLTTLVMPYLWFSLHPITGETNRFGLVHDLHPLPCTLLIVRNVLFAALVAWLGVSLNRRSPFSKTGREPVAPRAS